MQINQYLEHTKLNADLTGEDINILVEQAINFNLIGVCIPPFWVERAHRELNDSDVKLITVVGFPFGYQMTESKIKECELAMSNGVDEVDLVMNISAFKAGMQWMKIEVAKCAKLLHDGGVALKVILETALLTNEEIVLASKMAVDAGADYLKTSTGFSKHGATTEHVRLMKGSVPDDIGIKASGGIKSLADALSMIESGATRIGTSNAMNILQESNRNGVNN